MSIITGERTNVVLHEQDIQIVTEFSTKLGVSFSAGLRMIVRDWAWRTLPQPPAQPEQQEAKDERV